MERVKTVCKLCGLSGCGMVITVENGRAVRVEGDADHPENLGALCPKGRAVLDVLFSPDRLTHPLRRRGTRGCGDWEPIGWDEALDWAAFELQKAKAKGGPESVVFHKGSGHDLCAGDVRPYLHRLANVFGTPNVSSPFYVCNGPRTMNLFHVLGSVPAPDVDKAECVVLWGINPATSAINRYRRIREAKARGACLIEIDPRTTPLARQADLHLRPRPGSDGALALGMLRIAVEESLIDPDFVKKYTVGFTDLCRLVEQYTPGRVAELTWVPEAQLREAARLYASEPSACVFLGQALDQHTNASNSIRAIACLIAVTGHLDVPGGNVVIPPVRLAKNPVEMFDELPQEIREKRLGSQYLLTRFPFTQIAHPPSVFQAILTGDPYPVHAMLVMASNPASVEPHTKEVIEALRRLDFLAVADLFMTDTAKQADLVLPACTFLEDTYYATYEAGSYSRPAVPGLMQLRPKVVEPVGECRPDWRIIFDLAESLGLGGRFPWADIEEAIDFELEPMSLSVAALKNNPNGIQLPAPPFLLQKLGGKGLPGRLLIRLLSSTVFRGYPVVYRKYKRMGFLTPSGKVELRSSVFEEAGLNPLPGFREPAESVNSAPDLATSFPLVLSTGAKTRNFVHSQFHNIPRLSRSMPVNLAEIHPETAQGFGVEDGGEIQVETPRGTIRCAASLTPDILPGVVQLFHGFPESNANILTDNRYLDPATGSASMRSELCRIIPG